jgi:hypothetical protein
MQQKRIVNAAAAVLVAAAVLLLSGCSKSPQTQNQGTTPTSSPAASPAVPQITSESVVRFASEPLEIAAGGTGEATVHVTVQNGYHVNANPPTYPFLRATELNLTPPTGITVGFIRYPNGVVKKFPFAEKPVAIYEGDTTLKVSLKAVSSVAKGPSNLQGKLKVQACDDQVCYAPGEVSVTVPVTIK